MKPVAKKLVKIAEYFEYKMHTGLVLSKFAYNKISKFIESNIYINKYYHLINNIINKITNKKFDIISTFFLIIAILLIILLVIFNYRYILTLLLLIILSLSLYIMVINVQENTFSDDEESKKLKEKSEMYYMVLTNKVQFALMFDENNKIKEYIFPQFIKQNIEVQVKDIYGYFIYHTGKENMPLLTLEKLEIQKNDLTTIYLGISSFLHIYYTHYFADIILSYVVSEETFSGKTITLRKMLLPYLQNYYINQYFEYKKSNINTKTLIYKLENLKNNMLTTVGELPNSLGITGIVLFGDYYIIQVREKESMEGGSLTWSFSGLLSPYSELVRNHDQDLANLTIYDIIYSEYNDEFVKPLQDCIPSIGTPPVVEPLAIIFNGQNLFQFELAVFVQFNGNINIDNDCNNLITLINSPNQLVNLSKLHFNKYLFVHKKLIHRFLKNIELHDESTASDMPSKSSLLDVIWSAYVDKYLNK